MKKLLLSALMAFAYSASAQTYTYGFDGTTQQMVDDGWAFTNQSSPTGASNWSIPTSAPAAFPGGGQAGGNTSLVLVNFNSTTGSGTISNWLLTPTITVDNGSEISFYTRKGGDGTTTIYPDRLELRMSTNGASSVIPSSGAADLGDFTELLVSVNPDLTTTDYPFTWTQYTYTISGLSGPTECRFAFRYYVTSGGPDGTNSDIIAVDSFSADGTLGTKNFFAENFTIYPNPAKDVLNLSSNNQEMNSISITDINGRVVRNIQVSGSMSYQVDVSDLTKGIYFISVVTGEGIGVTKIIKN